MKQENKLLQYSAMAVSFIFLKEGNAQVIYTDIVPDLVFDEPLEGGGLDIDNNGIVDFAFQNNSFLFYSETFSSYFTRQDLLAGPYTPLNAIAGINEYTSSPYGGGFSLYYPYALPNAEVINDLREWQTAGQQILGIRTFVNYDDPNTWQCAGCYWYGYFIPETVDHFLGIRFVDDLSQNHYGWIRCDVLDEGRTLVIKDYAYESEADYPIVAGDTTHFVAISEIDNSLNANVYSFNKSIFINLNEFMNGIEMHIYDLNGKIIYSDKLLNSSTQIELKEERGVYFVELVSGKKKFRKKVYLN